MKNLLRSAQADVAEQLQASSVPTHSNAVRRVITVGLFALAASAICTASR